MITRRAAIAGLGALPIVGAAAQQPAFPSKPLTLQWATYFDAADQAGQSRIYGGIHLEPDDLVGRKVGSQIGLDAVARARAYFDGTAR